jgi:hypothetical protein
MSIVDKYSDKVVLDANFAKNSFLDQTGLHTLVNNNNPNWINNNGQRALNFNGINQFISVADADDLSFGDGSNDVPFTMVVQGKFRGEQSGDRMLMITKGTVGANGEYSLNVAGTGEIIGGAIDNSEANTYIGRQYSGGLNPYEDFVIALTYNGNGTSAGFKIYLNGSQVDDGNFENNPGNYVAMENLGAEFWFGRSTTSYAYGLFHRAIIWNNQELTATEISQLTTELEAKKTLLIPRRNYVVPTPKSNDATLILHYDGFTLNSDGKMQDLSGNGNHGTLSGGVTFERGVFDRSSRFNNSSAVISDASSIFTDDGTMSFWVKQNASENGDYFINYFESSSDAWGAAFNTTSGGVINLSNDIDNAGQLLYGTSLLSAANIWNHVVIVQDSLENKMYVNGQLVGSGTSSSGNLGSFAGTLYVGARSNAAQFSDANICNIKVFTEAKDQAWVSNEYLQGAKIPRFYQSMVDVPPTLVNLTAAEDRIGETEFKVFTGQWRVSQDSAGQKWIENVSAGVCYTESLQAYGTWIFDLYKAGNGNLIDFLFMCDTKGAGAATGQDGYSLALSGTERVLINESTNGSQANLSFSAADYVANATKYSLAVTRRYDGQTTYYIKNGAFTAWTLVDTTGGSGTNPFTDTTVTASKYTCVDMDAGDKFSDVLYHEGVLTLAQLQSYFP